MCVLLSSCRYFFVILCILVFLFFLFFFNDTATTEIYTLSLHDALPISVSRILASIRWSAGSRSLSSAAPAPRIARSGIRSEEHTSELQSLAYLVCRLLLEKKKKELHNTVHD